MSGTVGFSLPIQAIEVDGISAWLVEDQSVPARFRDFGAGVLTISGVVYFLSWAAGLLYVNMVLLSRRQWAGGQASQGRWTHALVRALAGIVGVEMRKVQEFTVPWPAGSLLVMHSDGLATHWKLDRGSPLASKHPGVIAGVLYRDHARGRDDVTVVVARDGGPVAR